MPATCDGDGRVDARRSYGPDDPRATWDTSRVWEKGSRQRYAAARASRARAPQRRAGPYEGARGDARRVEIAHGKTARSARCIRGSRGNLSAWEKNFRGALRNGPWHAPDAGSRAHLD